ncbi:MAG: alpha/beta hydrolase [Steroidobacteraceae bacterium]|jgi:pimeloyl-ACP methyl ester carboxylesterase|nr:alpha/beta hydrolase [Steroidobacteraceae bacterium]
MTTLLGIGLAAYGGLVLLAYLGQERLLFLPQPLSEPQAAAIAARHAGVARLDFEGADGTALHAWWVPPSPAAPVLLYFGGNAENVAWMLDRVQGPGALVPGAGWLLVDYRGYGRSAGRPGETELVADAVAAHDLVRARTDAATPILSFGRSLGSGIAVQLAARRSLAGLVLMTPFDSTVAVGRRHYAFLPVGTLLRHRFDSLALAPTLQVPALFLVAERDFVIPPAHARRLHDAWAGPKRWHELPGVGHNDTERVDYGAAVRAFVAPLPAR